MRVRDHLVDGPDSLGARLRRRRFQLLLEWFPDLDRLRVLDLGGTTTFWQRAEVRPAYVRVVNLVAPGEPDAGLDPVIADACDPSIAADPFDLAFSNSLLEHLGGHANRARLAAVIRQAAPRHWVQTPYRYFPIEPHHLFPGMQFAPVNVRSMIAQHWPLGHTRCRCPEDATATALWTELIGRAEMAHLFPDSRVCFEWVAGVPKSLLAVRT